MWVAGGQGERAAWAWSGDPVSAGAEIRRPGECFITIYFPMIYSGRKQALVGLNSSVSWHLGVRGEAQRGGRVLRRVLVCPQGCWSQSGFFLGTAGF